MLIRFIRKNMMTIGLFILLVGFVFYQRYPLYRTDQGYIDKPAPDFQLKSLGGDSFRLQTLRGKTVLINFWATWCLPCRVERPILNSIYEEFKGRNFEILAITVEDEAVVRRHLSGNETNYPILLDPDGKVTGLYNIMAFPTLIFIDAEGKIVDIGHGLNPLLKWKIRRTVTGSLF